MMCNIDELFGARDRKLFKRELVQFYAHLGFTHALTLSWHSDPRHQKYGRKVSPEQARRNIGALLARVDRRLLGTKFHKRREERTGAVFFIEHADSNLHAHGLVRPPSTRLLDFHRLFPGERGGCWNDIAPSGTYRLNILHDPITAVGYMLKEQHLTSDERLTVWADEFFA